MAEDLGRCVTEVGVDQLAGDDAVAVEGLAIGKVSVRHACIGRGIEPVAFKLLVLVMGHWSGVGETYHPDSVSFSRARSSSLMGSMTHCQPMSTRIEFCQHTSVKWCGLSLVGLPEVLALVRPPLGRRPLFDIGVLGITHGVQQCLSNEKSF